jgi:magnesium and cobalt transporter
MNDAANRVDESDTLIERFKRFIKNEPESREDIIDFLDDARLAKILANHELSMLKGVLQVSQIQVREVMVPRSQMVVLDQASPPDELLHIIVECGHSRYPVIGEERDEVVGILLAKDVLKFFLESPGVPLNIKSFLRPATFIPESKRLDTLLQDFRSSRNHMAIVVDEYGGIAGLLTIEDVLEEIVGDIDDEHDPEEVEHIQEQGDHWNVLALTRIDEFNEYFSASLRDDDYETVGGLVMRGFGRLPKRGEAINLGGFNFRVSQADRRRIHRLEVTREAVAEAAE